MKILYKKIKVAMPHCPKCGEQLGGNGSFAIPYRCSCGIWEPNLLTGEYDVDKPKDLEETREIVKRIEKKSEESKQGYE